MSFPDLTEALTDGADEVAALVNRITHGEDIAGSSQPKCGQRLLPNPLVATKAVLHRAMTARGAFVSKLAPRLRADRMDARCLLDPRHRLPWPGRRQRWARSEAR